MLRTLSLCLVMMLARPVAADIGLKAGVSSADLLGSGVNGFGDESGSTRRSGARFGFTVGATLDVTVSRYVAARAEMLYAQKGAEYLAEFGDPFIGRFAWSGTMKLDYLETPLFFRLHWPSRARLRPYVDLGGYAGLILNARFTTSTTTGPDISSAYGLWDRVSSWDLGAVVGGGLEFSAGDRRYFLEFRYCPGLLDIDQRDDTVKNTSVSLTASMPL